MAVLTSVMTRIADDVEALTPPTDATLTYHEVDGRRKLSGSAGHRAFWFEPPIRSEVVLFSSACSVAEWELELKLRLRGAGKSVADAADAVADESDLVARAIEQRADWPIGTYEVLVDTVEPETEESGDTVLTVAMRVTTGDQ